MIKTQTQINEKKKWIIQINYNKWVDDKIFWFEINKSRKKDYLIIGYNK